MLAVEMRVKLNFVKTELKYSLFGAKRDYTRVQLTFFCRCRGHSRRRRQPGVGLFTQWSTVSLSDLQA